MGQDADDRETMAILFLAAAGSPRGYAVAVARPGDAAYEPLMRQIRDDAELIAEMWADGGAELVEHPAKTWAFVVDCEGAPVAWRAFQPGPCIRLTDAYHRRTVRDLNLFTMAFEAVHWLTRHAPCESYLYEGPRRETHIPAGWLDTGEQGYSIDPGQEKHFWWRMWRPADAR